MSGINLLLLSFSVIGGCLFFFILIKHCFIYNGFRDYLLSTGDKDTLQELRKLNPFGIRKFPSSPLTIIKVNEIIFEKYEQTKDDSYLLFTRKYMRGVKQMVILAVLLFILCVFYITIKTGTNSKHVSLGDTRLLEEVADTKFEEKRQVQ